MKKNYTTCHIKNRKHKDKDNLIQFGRVFEYMYPICKYCEKPTWKIKFINFGLN